MTTPSSPERPPNLESLTIAPAIDKIAGGDFSRTRLAALSDLDRRQVAYLRTRWADIQETERHALVLALAELGEASLDFDFRRVFRVALDDPNPVIRQLSIENLWEDDNSDLALQFVQMLQNDPSDDVRAAAAGALSTACDALADGTASALDQEKVFDLLARVIDDPAESPIVRRRSLAALASFAAEPGVNERIRSALDDEDQAVVAGAVYAMGRTSNANWLPEIIEYMQSEDAELRFESARAAGLLGEPEAVPALAELVYDHDPEVRAAALDALGEIGGPAAIRVLRQVEQDEDFQDVENIDEAMDAALLSVDPLERRSK